MNIAFAKLGKSIKFKTNFSPTGGDNEAPALLRLLANNNPNINFHLIGRSDMGKLTPNEKLILFPYNNVFNVFDGLPTAGQHDRVIEYFDDLGIQPDAFVAMVGSVSAVNLTDKIRKVDGSNEFVNIIQMAKKYVEPAVRWMNTQKDLKLIEVCNDPRYTLSTPRDIFADPCITLSQYNYTYTRNSVRDYEDQTRSVSTINCTYAEMEKIFLFDKVLQPASAKNRDKNLMIVLNEISAERVKGRNSRYDALNDWVLQNVDDVEIYGKWEHEKTLDDCRFKGPLQIDEVQSKLRRARSSFIVPIKTGWVTSKYIELIHAGVVPFFHPSYDDQNSTDVPEFLRPKTSEELMSNVKMLEDDSTYEKIIKELQDKYCTDEYYNGTKLNNIIMSHCINNYKAPELKEYEAQNNKPFDLTSLFN